MDYPYKRFYTTTFIHPQSVIFQMIILNKKSNEEFIISASKFKEKNTNRQHSGIMAISP